MEDRLPSVVAPMAGREPVWLVDGSFGRWQAGDTRHKSVWVLSRPAAGELVVTGRRLEDRSTMRFQDGAGGTPTERLVIADPASVSVVPGHSTPEILERYRFVMSYLIYPEPGCWEIDARLGEEERRIVVEIRRPETPAAGGGEVAEPRPAVFVGTAAGGAAARAPDPMMTGLFVIHAEAPSPDELPEPPADRWIARYDYGFLREEERGPPKYFLLGRRPDVPLLLAGPPRAVEGERGLPELLIELSEEAAEQMERVTRENLGRGAAFLIDGEVVTAHKIRAVIEGGRLQLSRCTDRACEFILARLETR